MAELQCGDTFLQGDGYRQIKHLWIIITEPLAVTSDVVVVNVSTLRHGADQTVTLGIGDHSFIRHQSFINFAGAQVRSANQIAELIAANKLERHDRCTAQLIKLLQQGIRASEFTPKRILRFLNDNHS